MKCALEARVGAVHFVGAVETLELAVADTAGADEGATVGADEVIGIGTAAGAEALEVGAGRHWRGELTAVGHDGAADGAGLVRVAAGLGGEAALGEFVIELGASLFTFGGLVTAGEAEGQGEGEEEGECSHSGVSGPVVGGGTQVGGVAAASERSKVRAKIGRTDEIRE